MYAWITVHVCGGSGGGVCSSAEQPVDADIVVALPGNIKAQLQNSWGFKSD